MKVIICGGRDWNRVLDSFKVLDEFHRLTPITHVIQGGATGADKIGAAWAKARGIVCDEVPAEWDDLSHPDAIIKTNKRGKKYDAHAGHRRNLKMANMKPDCVLAFPGGDGTENMCRTAKAMGILVHRFFPGTGEQDKLL